MNSNRIFTSADLRSWHLHLARVGILAACLLLSSYCLADSGRWKDNGNQTLTDTFTGQQWTKHDNLKNINWADAKRYCETLSLVGGRWQLPGIDDLAAIYSAGRDGTTQCGSFMGKDVTCKVSSLFYLSDPFFWSSTSGLASNDNSIRVWSIDLSNGNRGQGVVSSSNRALCMRHS